MVMKNILIIDDSALMRRVISDIIESDKRFNVIGAAINGVAGISMLQENIGHVDAVLLDINMPRMNGLEFLEELKKQGIKVTVIVVSAVTTNEALEAIRALELGAFDFVTKPESLEELRSNEFADRLLKILAVATNADSEEKPKKAAKPKKTAVAQKRESGSAAPPKDTGAEYKSVFSAEVLEPIIKKRRQSRKQAVTTGEKLVAIACSTGGPRALHSIIPNLPKNLDAAVVIVQHMPGGFTKSLAERLDALCPMPVKETEDNEVVKKGVVYIAKGGKQIRIARDRKGNHVIRLTKEEPRFGLLPCADKLYESLADTGYSEIICVVLTGMGSDGSAGILELSKSKKIHVIAQDENTSIVYGMPRMVALTGLVNEILPLDRISDAIIKKAGVQ